MKEHRKLIQQGRFYRLISPFEGNEAAWIVVSEDENKAIAAYFRFLQPVNTGFKRLMLKGLNPGTMYRVSGMDYTSYGDELMSAGLILSMGPAAYGPVRCPREIICPGYFWWRHSLDKTSGQVILNRQFSADIHAGIC